MSAMLARGYSKGPTFQSYDEMSAWDNTNTRPHVRSAVGAGFQVCFTDGGDTVAPVSKSARPPMGAPLDEVNTEFMDLPF